MSDFTVYLYALAVIIVGFLLIKKVASCLVRSAILIIAAIILAVIYYMFML